MYIVPWHGTLERGRDEKTEKSVYKSQNLGGQRRESELLNKSDTGNCIKGY
jgi:hypothetical protein